jgi:PAS domain S-box-containing protein
MKLGDFKMLFGASFDGILLTDAQGNILLFNKAYVELSGIPENVLKGRNMRDIISLGYLEKSVALMVIYEKKTITITHNNLPCGIGIVTGNPIFDENGELYRVVTNVRDMSEIYRLREELEKAQEMEKIYYQQMDQEKNPNLKNEPVAISIPMKEALGLARKISPVDVTVLILGESGVGKEVIAKYIHDNSTRKNGPFVAVNCGAIPEHLLESELFGYAAGSFTGALKNGKAGLFESAENGSLFLDEIGELPTNLQVKILRVLEMHEVTRIGECKSIPVNARILAATNRDLEEMVKNKTFRDDLYYRLNVIQITIPPLRERIEDIAPLSMHFLNHYNQVYHQKKRISSDALRVFKQHSWPGNIRELKNAMERLVVVSEGEYLDVNELALKQADKTIMPCVQVSGIMPLSTAVEEIEKQILATALNELSSSRKVAAAIGINQATVLRKMKKYGLRRTFS